MSDIDSPTVNCAVCSAPRVPTSLQPSRLGGIVLSACPVCHEALALTVAKLISKRTRAYEAQRRDALEAASEKAVKEARKHILATNLSLEVAARVGVAKHGGDFATVKKILKRFRKRELRALGKTAWATNKPPQEALEA